MARSAVIELVDVRDSLIQPLDEAVSLEVERDERKARRLLDSSAAARERT
jgi:hypothetical protein